MWANTTMCTDMTHQSLWNELQPQRERTQSLYETPGCGGVDKHQHAVYER